MILRQCLHLVLAILGGTLFGASLVSDANARENLKGMLAAQIRSQGVACDKPKKAVREAKQSAPDHDVWILTCENAVYRVSRYPDMAAQVERIR